MAACGVESQVSEPHEGGRLRAKPRHNWPFKESVRKKRFPSVRWDLLFLFLLVCLFLSDDNQHGSRKSSDIGCLFAGNLRVAQAAAAAWTDKEAWRLEAAKNKSSSSWKEAAHITSLAAPAKAKVIKTSNRKKGSDFGATLKLRQQQDDDSSSSPASGAQLDSQQTTTTTTTAAAATAKGGALELSITARVGVIRVPVESNAILKCLISSHADKFARKLDVHWSRYMYDENVYEQIESFAQNELADLQQQVAPPTDGARSAEQAELEPTINRQQQLRDFLGRVRAESNQISELLIEATLSIAPVKASDNASYFCTASDGQSEQAQARIDLVALSRPVVHLERVQPARDSKSALVTWLVLSDGNNPIKKTLLLVRNDTKPSLQSGFRTSLSAQHADESNLSGSSSSMVVDAELNQWQRLELDEAQTGGQLSDEQPPGDNQLNQTASNNQQLVDADVTSTGFGTSDFYLERWQASKRNKRRSFNLSSLLPGVTYSLRLAAINDLGQSNWSHISATMPNELPAQIAEVFLLSRAADSLAIGWRRPAYDKAKTIRYEMQLFDLNRTLTLDANTNTSTVAGRQRTQFMYVFVNLNPATDYHFQVRACSRAGCGAFSEPKLLATTLDGEPDEPLEVELNCSLGNLEETSATERGAEWSRAGKLSASWMPPLNARGLLLNYSVTFEAQARFRNQSGGWQVEEWRSQVETSDNQTLNVEAKGPLQPNTSYSARVCARNRAKSCGRLSELSERARCKTAPELPEASWLPEITLRFGQAQLQSPTTVGDEQRTLESLFLELPFISRRNGPLHCIQLILVRLPRAFNNSSGDKLSNYLPARASELKVVELVKSEETSVEEASSQEAPLAYLAEEFDQTQLESGELQLGKQLVVLGDGRQASCKPTQAIAEANNRWPANLRPFDAKLEPLVYYTGFLRLVLVRARAKRKRAINQAPELEQLVAYSEYFLPARTGEQVLEVAPPGGEQPNEFQLNAQMNLQEMASKLGSSLKLSAQRLYNSSSAFLSRSVRLDTIGNFIINSSPMMQLFEFGAIILALSLLALTVIYLLTLPAARRRKRKNKMKRRLSKHQEAALSVLKQAQPELQSGSCFPAQQAPLGYEEPDERQVGVQLAQQQQQHQTLQQQQHEETPEALLEPEQSFAATSLKRAPHPDCPIHSSPSSKQLAQQQQQQQQQIAEVQVCQLPAQMGAASKHMYIEQQQQQQQQQLLLRHQHQCKQPLSHEELYARNCRTVRRLSVANGLPIECSNNNLNKFNPLEQVQPAGETKCQVNLTLSHQSSVFALAKKINKSIPLRLLGAVFECRLRNGWLKEEYEQLPRQQLQVSTQKTSSGLFLGLRPQLVVSRNDSVSALISGNSIYDAGLVKLGAWPNEPGAEKNLICAKSPLDADSVWDFWRLVYEREVSSVVMLTQNEDPNTGELRCAQYWPTCDNEETTILSPCNEFVQRSSILPAKFKIRQETLEEESRPDDFKVRRLTLIVMATRAHENEQGGAGGSSGELNATNEGHADASNATAANNPEDQDDEQLIIVERNILHLQFFHWNTSSLANQLRLTSFIELANEKHLTALKQQRQLESPTSSLRLSNPMLVHCFNGLGRSGLFAAMSQVLDELRIKLNPQQQQQQQQVARINLFQLVARLRTQREMLLSPYRLYELLYQLTSNCLPVQELQPHHHNTLAHFHRHHHRHNQQNQLAQQQQQQQQSQTQPQPQQQLGSSLTGH